MINSGLRLILMVLVMMMMMMMMMMVYQQVVVVLLFHSHVHQVDDLVAVDVFPAVSAFGVGFVVIGPLAVLDMLQNTHGSVGIIEFDNKTNQPRYGTVDGWIG